MHGTNTTHGTHTHTHTYTHTNLIIMHTNTCQKTKCVNDIIKCRKDRGGGEEM